MSALLLALSGVSHGFCGFYVSGADASLYNDATLTVLVRSGTGTVLSMQNNYQGPPADFAMVVPVPEVLDEGSVKTLPHKIFERVDTLAAPRLVEYWEQDPCTVLDRRKDADVIDFSAVSPDFVGRPAGLGVTVEARFTVAEYDIVILSAQDSGGLERWLELNRYNIPPRASALLAPYVAAGTKFFVAKVDVERVTFDGDRAVLSPLRMHFDSKDFSLPIRLGLLNSQGEQDLFVHVIAADRYEVANYENTTIPTNVLLKENAKSQFPAFYEALFSLVGRGRVVTEYAWQAQGCDPCPTEPLTARELEILGTDVLPMSNPVLTRLHFRYQSGSLGEDLVFRKAEPIRGGRGMPDRRGHLSEHHASPSSLNQFQGRYVILHPWRGGRACDDEVRGTWGGPPNGDALTLVPAASRLTIGERSLHAVNVGVGELLAEKRSDIPASSPTNSSRIPEVEP